MEASEASGASEASAGSATDETVQEAASDMGKWENKDEERDEGRS